MRTASDRAHHVARYGHHGTHRRGGLILAPAVRDFNLDNFEQQILDAWKEYPSEKLNDLFDMKSRVLECILTSDPPGGNNFTMPHRSAAEK